MPQAILLQDVETLGEKGTVVDVSPGYLRNYLLPRKLAEPATTSSIQVARRRREVAACAHACHELRLGSTSERRPDHRRPAPQPGGRKVGPGGGAARRAPSPRAAGRAAPAPGALLPGATRRGVHRDDRALRERPQ